MRRVLVFTHRPASAAPGRPRARAARGLDVTLAVPSEWRDPAFGRTSSAGWQHGQGYEVFPLPVDRPGDALRARYASRPLRSLLRDKRPDLVHVDEDLGSAATAQVARLAGRLHLPVVATSFTLVRNGDSIFARWRRRRLLRRLAGVVAAGEDAAGLVRADLASARVAVLPAPAGVSVPASVQRAPHDVLAIGFVGRLERRKGLDVLLAALAELRDMPWSLTVMGDGPERETLERQATALRLAARVRWAGALPADAVAQAWPGLDLLVVPSRRTRDWAEPGAELAAEAMANGVPVVACDSGVAREVVDGAGVIVPPESPHALAEAIAELADAERRAPRAHAARARALGAYSEDAAAERLVEFWRSVAAPGAARNREG